MFGTSVFGTGLLGTYYVPQPIIEDDVDMEQWPILVSDMTKVNFVEVLSEDPTLKTELEDGTYDTRVGSAWPNNLLKDFNGTYRFLSEANKRELDLFQRITVTVGVTKFRWIHPNNGKKYVMQLRSPIKFTVEPRKPTTYMATVELRGMGTFGLGKYGTGVYGA